MCSSPKENNTLHQTLLPDAGQKGLRCTFSFTVLNRRHDSVSRNTYKGNQQDARLPKAHPKVPKHIPKYQIDTLGYNFTVDDMNRVL